MTLQRIVRPVSRKNSPGELWLKGAIRFALFAVGLVRTGRSSACPVALGIADRH